MTLGELLKAGRSRAGKTLREVESLTGISNGYLSQLESNSVKQPSPLHLQRLADIYEISYARLMGAAGYALAEPVRAAQQPAQPAPFNGLDELNEEDRRKIQAYVDDLRAARRARSSDAS